MRRCDQFIGSSWVVIELERNYHPSVDSRIKGWFNCCKQVIGDKMGRDVALLALEARKR